MEGFEDDPGNMGEAEDNTSISSKGNRGGDTVHAGDLGLSSDSDSDTEPRGLSRSSRKGGMSSTSKETHSSGDGDLDDDGSDETASTRHTAPASSMQRPAAVARAGKNSMETLFGKDDEDDEKSVEEEEQTFADVEARSGSVGNLSRKGGMNSGAAAYTPANQTLEFSVLPRPRKGSKLYFARMPNIMGVKTEAFERETFKQNEEDVTFKFTTNIIRWRLKPDNSAKDGLARDSQGNPIRESNTRLVKWSDGSIQLLVGNEAFNVTRHRLNNSYMYVRQVDQDGTSCLECHGQVSEKLAFKPSSVHSKAHRDHTLAVRHRVAKGSKPNISILSLDDRDPELCKQEKAKEEVGKSRRERQKERKYSKYGHQGSRVGMNPSFLEEGDGYDETSLKAIKGNRYEYSDSSADDDADDDRDDDDDDGSSGDDNERERRGLRRPHGRARVQMNDDSASSDDAGDIGDAADDSDDAGNIDSLQVSRGTKRRRHIVDDEADSDED